MAIGSLRKKGEKYLKSNQQIEVAAGEIPKLNPNFLETSSALAE